MRRADALVDWDDPDDPRGNTQHVADHGLTPGEVESVLRDDDVSQDVSRSSGRPMVEGETDTGRWIVVVYEVLCEDPPIVRPVTAFEVDDPGDG